MDILKRPYPEKSRQRIKTGKIIAKLQKHIHGKAEMSPSQVQAARILLCKTLPDLSNVAKSGEVTTIIKYATQDMVDDAITAATEIRES